jgi:molecular chaperone DnaK
MLVQYRFDTLEDFVAEYSVNLSPGGIFIATEKPKGVGAIVYLQFALKDGSRLIEGLGQVARVVRPGGAEPAGMGVQFLNFDEESLALVRKICEQP